MLNPSKSVPLGNDSTAGHCPEYDRSARHPCISLSLIGCRRHCTTGVRRGGRLRGRLPYRRVCIVPRSKQQKEHLWGSKRIYSPEESDIISPNSRSTPDPRCWAVLTLLADGSGRPPHHEIKEETFLPSLRTLSSILMAALMRRQKVRCCGHRERYVDIHRIDSRVQSTFP